MLTGDPGTTTIGCPAQRTTDDSSVPAKPSLRARWHGPYLEQEVPLDPWGNPYQYNPTGRELNAITLYSYGPTGKPGGEAVGYLPAS